MELAATASTNTVTLGDRVRVTFTVSNPTNQPVDWLLESSYPIIDEIDFHASTDGSFAKDTVRVLKAGDQRPFHEWPVNYKNIIFPVNTPPGTHRYFLRVCSKGSLSVPLTAWSTQAFNKQVAAELPPQWMFYGIMLAMAIYNLFIFFSTREISHLYLMLFTVAIQQMATPAATSSLKAATCQLLYPPMEWPMMPWRVISQWKLAASTSGSSRVM